MAGRPNAVDVLFVQGAGEGAHDEDAALAASLAEHLGVGFTVHYPRMPGEGEPDIEQWAPVITESLRGNGPVVLVGHSAGGFQLLACLSRQQITRPVIAVCLIAVPFPGGDPDWTFEGFDLSPDLAEHLPSGAAVLVYAAPDDAVVPFAHRDLYAEALPRAVARTASGGHQLNGDLRMVADDILALTARVETQDGAAP